MLVCERMDWNGLDALRILQVSSPLLDADVFGVDQVTPPPPKGTE